MGGCTSKTGHEVDSLYRDNRKPVDKHKKKSSVKNGSVKKKYLDCEFPNNPGVVQNDLSDTVYTEDSHTFHAVEDCINKSQQTSLDHLVKDLVKDANKNIESMTNYRTSSGNKLCNSDTLEASTNKSSKSTLNNVENSDTCDGKVVASDSGIVVENTGYSDDVFKTEHSVEEEVPKIHSEIVPHRPTSLPLPLNLEPIHSHTCSELTSSSSSRSQVVHSAGSLGNDGECQGHLLSAALHMNRSSETLMLKSSLKKDKGNFKKKKSRLSWKSADSLDLPDAMATSLDRAKSLASSIFGFADEMNLIAPLATFDSEFAIGNSYHDFSKLTRSSNCVEYCSDTFNFKFDFSGLEGDKRRSIASVDRSIGGESCPDVDKIKLAIRQSSISTPIEER